MQGSLCVCLRHATHTVSKRLHPGGFLNTECRTLLGCGSIRQLQWTTKQARKRLGTLPEQSYVIISRPSKGSSTSSGRQEKHHRLEDDIRYRAGYSRIAVVGTTTFTLCRSRDNNPSSGHSSADSVVIGHHSDGPEQKTGSDISNGVEIPIDFGGISGSGQGRLRRTIQTVEPSLVDTLQQRLKNNNNSTRLFFSSGKEPSNSPWLLGLFPVLGKVSPIEFGNVFLAGCCGMFGLWCLSERSSYIWLARFLQRHFVASRSALDMRRYHTLLTCALSHTGLMHLLFNCAMFHTLMNTFQRNMCYPASSPWSSSSLDRFLGGLYSSMENFLWGEQRHQNYRQHVQTADIVNVMLLSAVGSSLGHVLLNRTPVIGASGAISGLLYLLASTFPNSYFRTVFPIPGLELSILQVGQLFVATNLYFVLFGSGWGNVAWAAHLFGMATGALYCLAQQYVFHRPGFHNAITMSIRSAKRQWIRTFRAITGGH